MRGALISSRCATYTRPMASMSFSGNHESIFGYQAWMAHYAAIGLRLLENEHIVLDRDGRKAGRRRCQ